MVEMHLWLLIPLVAVGCAFFVTTIFFVSCLLEGVLVWKKKVPRHPSWCWEESSKRDARIRHLEQQLRLVPVEMRSRKTKKLIGESRR